MSINPKIDFTECPQIVELSDRFVSVKHIQALSKPIEHTGGPSGNICKETVKVRYTLVNGCYTVVVPIEQYKQAMTAWCRYHRIKVDWE